MWRRLYGWYADRISKWGSISYLSRRYKVLPSQLLVLVEHKTIGAKETAARGVLLLKADFAVHFWQEHDEAVARRRNAVAGSTLNIVASAGTALAVDLTKDNIEAKAKTSKLALPIMPDIPPASSVGPPIDFTPLYIDTNREQELRAYLSPAYEKFLIRADFQLGDELAGEHFFDAYMLRRRDYIKTIYLLAVCNGAISDDIAAEYLNYTLTSHRDIDSANFDSASPKARKTFERRLQRAKSGRYLRELLKGETTRGVLLPWPAGFAIRELEYLDQFLSCHREALDRITPEQSKFEPQAAKAQLISWYVRNGMLCQTEDLNGPGLRFFDKGMIFDTGERLETLVDRVLKRTGFKEEIVTKFIEGGVVAQEVGVEILTVIASYRE